MKAIHVIPALSIEAAGPSYSVPRLCESLISRGVDVELGMVRMGGNPPSAQYFREFPLGAGPRRLGRSPALLRWLGNQAASGSTDILHSHALWMMPCVYPARVSRLSGIPLVISPRGSLAPEALRISSFRKAVFWRLEQGAALRSARLLHATAESELHDVRAAGLTQPVAVVPNGIDIPPPRPERGPARRRILLYLGRIHPIKGLDVLLQAWARVSGAHPDWDLRIVGPGEPEHVEAVRRQATDLRVERVQFAGPAYGAERLAAYYAADLYVLPTRSENFGMTVAESLAAGTPAITTTGAPWAGLRGREAGWWIEPGVEPLVAALEDALAAAPARLAGMGANGRRWMCESFDWSGIGEVMRSVYEWLCGRGPRPACVHD